ncbi:bacteriophage T4 gp5 trimerisation domain-containing protein [Acidaminococcus timonensis]|uniref:ESPR-type extended signal peptide-containing protein n=1 Tax=Acidaminococcus timonensis TaxID=1871002 RepID=UPI00307D7D83
MNKIYKVIWNKTRGMYMVVSELAKSQSKGSGSVDTRRKLTRSAAALALFFSVISAGGTAWAADMTTVKDTSDTVQTVYTKNGVDAQLTEYAKESAVQTNTAAITTNTKNVAALQTAVEAKANAADVYSKTEADTKFATKDQLKQDVSAINLEVVKKADKATTLAGYGITDAYTKAEVDTADANLQKAIDEEARKRKYSVTNLEKADEQLQTNINLEATAREAADTTLQTNIDNEAAARKAADGKLVDAVNSGLSLSNDNVLQKNTTAIDDWGNVTTSKTDAKEMILNKGNDNQITLNDKGIKVGLNSTVQDANGFYAGGDTAAAAKAALNADGSIKGADGKFTVDTAGNVATKGGSIKTNGGVIQTGGGNINTQGGALRTNGGNINTGSGTITGNKLTDGVASLQNGNLTTTGNINAHDIVATGDISGKAITGTSLNTQGGDINGGAITGTTITGTTGAFGSLTTTGNASVGGTLSSNGLTNTGNATTDTLKVNHNATVGGNLAVTGDITGKSLNVGTGAISGGQITGTGLEVGAGTIKTTGAVETGTLETTGNATIGGDLTVDKDLTVNGTFDAKTLSSTVDANNYTTINGGKTQSVNLKLDAVTGETKASASTFDENGSNTWAKDDDSIGKSSVTADGISQKLSNTGDNPTAYAESTMSQGMDNKNKYTMTDTVKDGDKTNVAFQSATESSDVVTDANGNTSTFRQRVDALLQEIKNAAGAEFSSVEQKLGSITGTVTDGTNTTSTEQTTKDITNKAENGTITNTAKDLVNTAAENMTNTVGKDLTTTVGGNETRTVKGTLTETVIGNVTEDYKANLDTKVGGNETHYVAGNQTNTVSGDRTVNVKGTEKENFNAQVTNVKTDQKTSVGGNQTNIVDGDQQNTVSGSKTETVKGSVKEKYGSQETTVDGDQSTHVGGNQENVVAGNQINTISGNKTETVKGAVNETYGSQTTKVNGDQSTTVTGKQTTTVTGDVTEDYKANLDTKIGGNQSTEVTGDSSLTAENITNEAKNKITNKALDVETDASSSIVSKVSNEYGSNTSTQLSYQTTEEMSQADGKKASYLRGAAEEKSQLTDGDKKTTVDTIAGQTNTNITDGTNTSNSLQKADQAASSVTDGTNTTVVNQDAKSLASSITDGAKANNTNSTVDKSEQLIKASDTQYSATTKTATKTEDTLVSGSSVIDVIKSLDDAGSPTISSAVTDGTNSTGITQTAKDITNTAKNGTIANDAKDIINNAAEDMTNTVGKDLTTTVGGEMKTTVTGKTTENYNGGLETTITGEEKHTVNGSQINNITGDQTNTIGGSQTTTVTGDSSLSAQNITNTAGTRIQDKVGTTTVTTIDGLTKLTNEAGNHKTQMDYAEVLKDLGVKGNATIDKDLSVGGNATVAGDVTAKSYKVGDKTYIDENGINGNGQKVTNVADGDVSEGSTDAVNGGQLHATNQRVSTVENRMDGVENRVDRVENRVDNLDNRIDKVGASAAAMANLHPMDFDEDSKVSVAAAVGNYRSETAGALGVFYRPTDRVMMNISTSFGNGENMVGGGVSFKLGKSSKRLQQAEATNAALSKQVTNLQNRLDALLGVLNASLSKDFPDVPANHWAYEAVSRLAGNGIIQGYEDGKYHGERTMTRYEMAEIIYNALSKGAKAEAKLVEEFRPELQAMAAQRKA